MNKHVTLALLWLMPILLEAQISTVQQNIELAKNRNSHFESFSLFEASTVPAQMRNAVQLPGNPQFLELKPEALQALFAERPKHLMLSIPSGKNSASYLELRRYDLLAPGFKVTTNQSNGQAVPYSPGVFYRGVVAGSPGSVAVVSVTYDEVLAIVQDGTRQRSLGRVEQGDDDQYVVWEENAAPLPSNFTCEALPTGKRPSIDAQVQDAAQRGPNCVQIYLEMDNKLATEKGGVQPATDYLTSLFNVVATLYQNESVTIVLTQVHVWVTPDIYSNTSLMSFLSSFKTCLPEFSGDIAHFVSRSGPEGGIAWLDALCTSFKYGYSYIYTYYNALPTYSWSVNVLTHEIGHNLGSPHTHDCAWNGNFTAIDGCGPAAGYGSILCPAAPLPPAGGGTIMSYCHLIGNVGINFQNGFGQQPGDLIRDRVSKATCLATCAETPLIFLTKKDISCYGMRDGAAMATVTGGKKPYTYFWSNKTKTQSISSLAAGTYKVTVTDSIGMQAIGSVAILQPAILSASAKITPASASGVADGRIDLTVNGGTQPYTFLWSNGATNQNLADIIAGTYACTVTDVRGCKTTINASVLVIPRCSNPITIFPYVEDFETGFGVWSQSAADQFDWTRFSSPTPTASTGPDLAYSGQYFLYTEATGNFPTKKAELLSSCFDFTKVQKPEIWFWYHMLGRYMGTLEVYVQDLTTGTVARVWTKSRNAGSYWREARIALYQYAGKPVQIRISGITSTGESSDIGLDYIKVFNNQSLNSNAVNAVQFAGLPAYDYPFEPDGSPARSFTAGAAPVSESSLGLEIAALIPNPAATQAELVFYVDEEQPMRLSISDLTGRPLRELEIPATSGRNAVRLDVADLPQGVHLVALRSNTAVTVSRLLIARSRL
jgi:hypothetical protein